MSKKYNSFYGISNSCLGYCISFLLIIFSACTANISPGEINKSEAYNKIGYSHLKNGDLNEAYIAFQKAIQLNPENREALNYLGYINVIYKKNDEAISYYKKAIKADSNYSEAHNNLGVVYAETGRWDEAIEQFESALENALYSTPERAYSNLGYALYMKGDFSSAQDALNEAIMRNPVMPKAMYILGLIHVKMKNDDDAVNEFIKAIGIYPDYLEAHWELGMAYVRAGKKDKAYKHFEAIAEKAGKTDLGRKAVEQIELLKY